MSEAPGSGGGCDTASRRVAITIHLLCHDLWFDRGLGRVMDHRVGVFDADSVSAALLFEQRHEIVVMFLVLPIALPFEQSSDGRQSNRAGLDHA